MKKTLDDLYFVLNFECVGMPLILTMNKNRIKNCRVYLRGPIEIKLYAYIIRGRVFVVKQLFSFTLFVLRCARICLQWIIVSSAGSEGGGAIKHRTFLFFSGIPAQGVCLL
jgi:hypothetical protein